MTTLLLEIHDLREQLDAAHKALDALDQPRHAGADDRKLSLAERFNFHNEEMLALLAEARAERDGWCAELERMKKSHEVLSMLAATDYQARDTIRNNWIADERKWLAEKLELRRDLVEACDIALVAFNTDYGFNHEASIEPRRRIVELRQTGTR